MPRQIARHAASLALLCFTLSIVPLFPAGQAEAQTTADQKIVALTECRLLDGAMDYGVAGDISTVDGMYVVCGIPLHYDKGTYYKMIPHVRRTSLASSTSDGYCRSRVTGHYGAGGAMGLKVYYETTGDHEQQMPLPSVSSSLAGWWTVTCYFAGGDGSGASYRLYGILVDEYTD